MLSARCHRGEISSVVGEALTDPLVTPEVVFVEPGAVQAVIETTFKPKGPACVPKKLGKSQRMNRGATASTNLLIMILNLLMSVKSNVEPSFCSLPR